MCDILLNDLVDAVEIKPQNSDHASVAQVIGVGLGRLDTWYSDSALQAVVTGTRVTHADDDLTNATTNMIAAARNNCTFDSIEALLLQHGAMSVMVATIFAVAATLESWAEHDGVPVKELTATVLLD